MFKIEKRKMKRFSLELTTCLLVVNEKIGAKSLDLFTSNICSGGAFFKTKEPLPIGTEVHVGMILPLDRLKNLKTNRSRIDVSGWVIRTDGQGMAISFDRKYSISPLHH